MKILMVLDREFPPDLRVENEIEALTANGHEIFLACYTRKKRPSREKNGNLTILRRDISDFIYKSSVAALTFPFYFRFWENFLISLYREFTFDAIHIHDLPLSGTGLKLKKRFSVPLTVDLHENWPAYLRIATHTRSIAGRILSPNNKWVRYEKAILPQADQIIVVVEEARERLISMGLDPDKVKVVSNTLNIRHAHIPPRKSINTIPLLFYAGGINYHRGLQTVIQALAETKKQKYRLVVLGEGSYKNDLIALTRSLGLEDQVSFPGWKPYEEMLEWMGQADYALIPHLKSDHTDSTIPHKLFQYMYAKLPVIASNCSPLERILRETQAGIIFPSDNHEKLAEILDSLQEKKIEEMRNNGRLWIEKKYNWNSDAQVLNTIYEE